MSAGPSSTPWAFKAFDDVSPLAKRRRMSFADPQARAGEPTRTDTLAGAR